MLVIGGRPLAGIGAKIGLWGSQGGLQESPLPQPDRGYGARAGMPKAPALDILSCLYCHIKRGRRTEDAPGRRKGLFKAYEDGCAADRRGRRAGRFRPVRPCSPGLSANTTSVA